MTKLEQAARQALGALEVATTPLAKDRQEVLRAITTLREALSGVQALSAAPAEQQAQPGAVYAELPAPTASIGIDDAWHEPAMRDFADRTHALRMEQAAPKAAPQQEAQVPVAYVHVPHSTVEGKVRPVVSFEKYQQDYADGIYSTRIPLYAAPQPAPAPLSDDVLRDAAFEAVRKKLCALPRFSFLSDGYGVRRVPDKSGSWIAFDAAHALFDPVAVDAALAAQGGK